MTVEMFNLIEEEGEGKKYEEKEVSGGGLSGQIGAGLRSPKTEGLRHGLGKRPAMMGAHWAAGRLSFC